MGKGGPPEGYEGQGGDAACVAQDGVWGSAGLHVLGCRRYHRLVRFQEGLDRHRHLFSLSSLLMIPFFFFFFLPFLLLFLDSLFLFTIIRHDFLSVGFPSYITTLHLALYTPQNGLLALEFGHYETWHNRKDWEYSLFIGVGMGWSEHYMEFFFIFTFYIYILEN